MSKNRLKSLLKLGFLFFGFSSLTISCKQEELIVYEENNEINAKTVSFRQAMAFFENAKRKNQLKKGLSGKTSPERLVVEPDWNSFEHSDLVYTEALLTKANTTVNRNGDYTSKLIFINIDNQIKSVILTTWVTDYDPENNIVNATIYFNDYEGGFIDAYKIENGLFTKRLKPSPDMQTASFFILFQDREEDDCWNTDTLPEDGQLDAVNLGIIPSGGSGSGGYSGIGTGLPPGVTSGGGYGRYINGGINSGGGLVTFGGRTSITRGGIDIAAATIIMNPPIEPDDEGNCPPGYTKDPVTGVCISICNGGKVYNSTTKECECPDGKIEDDNDNCIEKDDDCDTSKEDLKKIFPNMSDTLLKIFPKYFSETDTIKKRKPDDYIKNSSKLANYVYCCRMGNGKETTEDGYKYRGRGIFQLTGKTNYSNFKSWYNAKYDPDKDFVKTPESLKNNDTIAILSALWFYKTNVIDKITIDSTTTVTKVTKKINGGTNGISDRKKQFKKAKDSITCK